MPAGAIQKNKKKLGQKPIFVEKVKAMFQKYHKALVVSAENVGANQLLHIRHDLQGKGEVLFGKNSLMRLAIRQLSEAGRPELKVLEDEIVTGAALIFSDGPFQAVREVLVKHCVGSPAKVGAISPVEVIIPPMKTTMGPTQVNVLHALNIQSKIFKGTIEITSEKVLIRVGDKVGASEANLLNILGILPFKYGVTIRRIYDSGKVYGPEILDISQDTLRATFAAALTNVAAASVAIGYPNQASAHHLIGAAFKQVASIAVAASIPLPAIAELQALLADPEALAKAQAAAAAAAPVAAPAAGAAPKVEEAKKEEEEVGDIGLGDLDDLFG